MGLLVVLLLAVVLFLVVLLPIRLLSRSAASRRGASPSAAHEVMECPAVVRRIWETGVTVKNNARVGMLLSVEPAHGDGFVVQLEQTMPRVQIQRIRPGHVITVRYLPTDRTRVVVVNLG